MNKILTMDQVSRLFLNKEDVYISGDDGSIQVFQPWRLLQTKFGDLIALVQEGKLFYMADH